MPLSVNVEAVFSGWDFFEGMEAVKRAGLSAYEFWTWWNKDIDEIAKVGNELGLETTAICTKFISLVDPDKRQEYKDALKDTLEVAGTLGCKTIISQVGDEILGIPRETQKMSIVEGLKECAPMLEKAGVTLVFEPLNTLVDHHGYYLWSSEEAFDIECMVRSTNIKVLYDIYHQQIMEGHLIYRIIKNIDRIGYFHAAGNPGRHELTTGEINYPEVFKAIGKAGYKGFIGLEYFPLGDPVKGLELLVSQMEQV
ncbi:MAG TPA: TIM barrel protein [Clostridia bacterium]|nr:TIM barrel protein [Clostridia bacterium]